MSSVDPFINGLDDLICDAVIPQPASLDTEPIAPVVRRPRHPPRLILTESQISPPPQIQSIEPETPSQSDANIVVSVTAPRCSVSVVTTVSSGSSIVSTSVNISNSQAIKTPTLERSKSDVVQARSDTKNTVVSLREGSAFKAPIKQAEIKASERKDDSKTIVINTHVGTANNKEKAKKENTEDKESKESKESVKSSERSEIKVHTNVKTHSKESEKSSEVKAKSSDEKTETITVSSSVTRTVRQVSAPKRSIAEVTKIVAQYDTITPELLSLVTPSYVSFVLYDNTITMCPYSGRDHKWVRTGKSPNNIQLTKCTFHSEPVTRKIIEETKRLGDPKCGVWFDDSTCFDVCGSTSVDDSKNEHKRELLKTYPSELKSALGTHALFETQINDLNVIQRESKRLTNELARLQTRRVENEPDYAAASTIYEREKDVYTRQVESARKNYEMYEPTSDSDPGQVDDKKAENYVASHTREQKEILDKALAQVNTCKHRFESKISRETKAIGDKINTADTDCKAIQDSLVNSAKQSFYYLYKIYTVLNILTANNPSEHVLEYNDFEMKRLRSSDQTWRDYVTVVQKMQDYNPYIPRATWYSTYTQLDIDQTEISKRQEANHVRNIEENDNDSVFGQIMVSNDGSVVEIESSKTVTLIIAPAVNRSRPVENDVPNDDFDDSRHLSRYDERDLNHHASKDRKS